MPFVVLWSRAFAVTLLIELLIAVPVLRQRAPLARAIVAVVFAQVLTHPAVWFIFTAFEWPRPLYLAVAETWALVGELCFYRFCLAGVTWSRALAAAALANGASYLVGKLLF